MTRRGEVPDRRHDRSGYLISFEGGEGAGKSTQIERLRARLAGLGRPVVVTREPGGSIRAEAIRRLILAGRAQRFGDFAETVLFSAARADHVERRISPALARGAVVLCDRFIDSTRVYQGMVGRVRADAIAALERSAVGGLLPDLTLVFDLPAEIGLRRASIRREGSGDALDRFEAQSLDLHYRVRTAFLAIAEAEPDRCAVLDAEGAPDEVEARVWSLVQSRPCLSGSRDGA